MKEVERCRDGLQQQKLWDLLCCAVFCFILFCFVLLLLQKLRFTLSGHLQSDADADRNRDALKMGYLAAEVHSSLHRVSLAPSPAVILDCPAPPRVFYL